MLLKSVPLYKKFWAGFYPDRSWLSCASPVTNCWDPVTDTSQRCTPMRLVITSKIWAAWVAWELLLTSFILFYFFLCKNSAQIPCGIFNLPPSKGRTILGPAIKIMMYQSDRTMFGHSALGICFFSMYISPQRCDGVRLVVW